jgi:hypothetical protein
MEPSSFDIFSYIPIFFKLMLPIPRTFIRSILLLFCVFRNQKRNEKGLTVPDTKYQLVPHVVGTDLTPITNSSMREMCCSSLFWGF